MAEARQRLSHGMKDMDLPRRVVHVVVATDHVRDVHVEVVHHYAEVVGGHAVGAQDHEVVELRIGERDRPLHQVVPAHVAVVGRAKADHRRAIRGRYQPRRLRPLRPPAAVIARLQAFGALRFAHGVQLFLGRPARISVPRSNERIAHRLVALEPLHLEERALVPVEAQPLHAVEDRVDRRLGGAFEVGVFHAQHEGALALAGESPRIQRGARAADVEEPRGAGGETGANRFSHVPGRGSLGCAIVPSVPSGSI